MRKICLLFVMCFLTFKLFSVDIYISSSYTNNINSNQQKTLKGAYDRVLNSYSVNNIVTETVNIYILDDIYLAEAPETIDKLIWDISGTSSSRINITSGIDGYPKIIRPIYDLEKNEYIIWLFNANYVKISGLEFPEAAAGIFINSSNYCTIKNCKFIGEQIKYSGGPGSISISRYPNSLDVPMHNIIQYNYIRSLGASTVIGDKDNNPNQPGYKFFHGIYIGHAYKTVIEYNTIINAPGFGIHYYHSYSQYTNVNYNTINMNLDGASGTQGGLILSYNPSEGAYWTVFGNINNYNYITTSEKIYNDNNANYYSPNSSMDLLIDNDLLSENSGYSPNYLNHTNKNGNHYAIDPYWIKYNPNKVTDRMVTGDFDGDGYSDDIAAMYDYGNNEVEIHTWLNKKEFVFPSWEQNKSFQYEGAWSSNIIDPTKVTGFVSGYFNDDNKEDVAVMYDDGGNTTRIFVWLSNGSSFSSAVWWSSNTGSYDATKVKGRFISGDFNGDGLDDIAAMYDYGNNNSRIHVWRSNNTSFNAPQTIWVSGTGSYNANKVTNRFVSGDFNGNGKCDIAAMYDYGSNNSRIHTWVSTGSSFYAPRTDWISGTGAYNATKVTGRFLSGDFSGDGKDDIAAMYDYGSNNSRIHTWVSTGSSFYAPRTDWISGTGAYDASKVTGRFLSGDFNNNGKKDITAMYDYSLNTNFYRTRNHVWESSGNSFILQNGSLGYPWMIYQTNISSTFKSTNNETNLKSYSTADTDVFELSLYPNPTVDNIRIDTELSISKIDIVTLSGKIITTINQQTKLVNLADLPAGIYLMIITTEEKIITKKFIKQ